jgi:hypothetical protein
MKYLLSLFMSVPLLALAGIEFEQTTVKTTSKLGDETADFIFKFKVTGDKKVRITNLDVSCSCLEATADKGEYAPGDHGEVKVVMALGSIEGEMVKYTTVATNDPKNPSIQLDCSINVPKIYDFQPMTTSWEVGEAPTTKEVKITVLSEDPVNMLKYASTRPNMQAEMTVVKPGREYVVKLTPKNTETPELGLITFETDCKIAKYTKRQVFFTINRKRTPTPPSAPVKP